MEPEKIQIYFRSGYAGMVMAYVKIGDEANGHTVAEIEKLGLSHGTEYVIDIDWLEKYLLKQIEEKGYTTSQSKRQKYPRLIINE